MGSAPAQDRTSYPALKSIVVAIARRRSTRKFDVFLGIYTYSYVFIYLHMCIYILICTCVYIYIYIHTHTHIYIYIYTYIYILIDRWVQHPLRTAKKIPRVEDDGCGDCQEEVHT